MFRLSAPQPFSFTFVTAEASGRHVVSRATARDAIFMNTPFIVSCTYSSLYQGLWDGVRAYM